MKRPLTVGYTAAIAAALAATIVTPIPVDQAIYIIVGATYSVVGLLLLADILVRELPWRWRCRRSHPWPAFEIACTIVFAGLVSAFWLPAMYVTWLYDREDEAC